MELLVSNDFVVFSSLIFKSFTQNYCNYYTYLFLGGDIKTVHVVKDVPFFFMLWQSRAIQVIYVFIVPCCICNRKLEHYYIQSQY